MKRSLLPLVLLLVFAANAQTSSADHAGKDSLYYRNFIFRLYPQVFHNGERLRNDEALQVFAQKPAALQLYRQYRNRYTVGMYSLAGMFTFLSASALGFDNGNRPLAAGGITLSVFSFVNAIVFMSSGESRLRKATQLYNSR